MTRQNDTTIIMAGHNDKIVIMAGHNDKIVIMIMSKRHPLNCHNDIPCQNDKRRYVWGFYIAPPV